MKLRCAHNSIRIRIRKSELEKLKKEGQLWESVLFVSSQIQFKFGICIVNSTDHEHLSATMKNNELIVYINKKDANTWFSTDLVSLEYEQKIIRENEITTDSLHILVEKDFPCKDRIDEDKADFFETLAIQQEKDKC